MQAAQTNILARDDTFFGVCEALGEDFGFNAQYLRIALGVLLIWNPIAVIAGYLVAGAVVALSRWLAPNPAFAEASAGEPVGEQGNDNEGAEMLAAAA